MSDSTDWFDTLIRMAVPAAWILMKVLSAMKKEAPTASLPTDDAPSPAMPAPTRRQRQAAQGARLLGRIHSLHTALLARRDQLIVLARARGPRGQVIREALDSAVASELADLTTALERAREGGLLDGSVSVDMLAFRLRTLMNQLEVLQVAVDLGNTPALDAVMADAEAITDACLAPIQQFTDFHEVPFPRTRALCLPKALAGGEAAWIGLLGLGIPVVFMPEDFEAKLMRWPSIAHELGHVLLHSIPGLEEEMGTALGWTTHTEVLRLEYGEIVGSPLQAWSAWREEILADALTVLMLGPAALEGFCAFFANPDDPESVLTATASNGRYNPHPPAHLRVHLAAFLLEELGFIGEGQRAAKAWNALHGFPERTDAEDDAAPALFLPLADGRYVRMNLEVAIDRGTHGIRSWLNTQYRALAGHGVLALPGFDLGPGVWARTRRVAESLLAGQSIRADGRVLLAAAIHAATQPGASGPTIADAVQRSILGRGEGRASPRSGARTGNSADNPKKLVLDALLLQEILARPAGPARRVGI